MAGVGTEKVFENDKVAVWNFELAPGEETPLHTHERSYMWYAISGAPLQVTDEHGNDVGTIDVPTGGVFSLLVDGDEIEVLSEPGKGMRVPARHKAKNVGTDALSGSAGRVQIGLGRRALGCDGAALHVSRSGGPQPRPVARPTMADAR